MIPVRLVDAATNGPIGEALADFVPRVGERVRLHAKGQGGATRLVEGETVLVLHDLDDVAAPPKRDKPLTTRVTVVLRTR